MPGRISDHRKRARTMRRDAHTLWGALSAAVLFTAALTAKSVADFTRTGPAIRAQIEAHYFGYAVYAVGRLAAAALVIAAVLAILGAAVKEAALPGGRRPWLSGFVAGAAGIAIGTGVAFAWALVHEPSTLVASWLYDVGHLVRWWFWIPKGVLGPLLAASVALAGTCAVVWAGRSVGWRPTMALAALIAAGVAVVLLVHSARAGVAASAGSIAREGRPNILIIASDTLRADRLGIAGYARNLTPTIDGLARRGTWLAETYVPIARTAPSITTILTGAWPRRHGVTTNFIRDEQRILPVRALPEVLRAAGYRTAAVGDWAASDLGKIAFGFDVLRVAPDQWNIKYLLRQGPKDLRLFLALFTHNSLGRMLLPEIYYLAGRPLTRDVGRMARRLIDELRAEGQPFFLFTFIATTHAPFGTEYPYYTMFSGPDYKGRSKFCMTEVFSPEAIAKRQAQGREAFDVQQIVDLYDAGVRRFDDEVRAILEHLEDRGLIDNTIVVVLSDHGTDLFERGTWGQGNTVIGEDPSNRIPLVIAGPGVPTRTVRATVRSVDIAPTIVELAGIEPGVLGADGQSLAAYLDGRDKGDRAAYMATGAWLARVAGMADDHVRVPPLIELLEIPDQESGTIALSEKARAMIEAARDRAVRWGRWKLVRIPAVGGPRYALYDRVRPEDGDQAERHPEVAQCLRRALDLWVADPAAAPMALECKGEA